MSYLRRNPSLLFGCLLIGLLLGFTLIGRFFVPYNSAFPLTGPPSMPPDVEFPFGIGVENF